MITPSGCVPFRERDRRRRRCKALPPAQSLGRKYVAQRSEHRAEAWAHPGGFRVQRRRRPVSVPPVNPERVKTPCLAVATLRRGRWQESHRHCPNGCLSFGLKRYDVVQQRRTRTVSDRGHSCLCELIEAADDPGAGVAERQNADRY